MNRRLFLASSVGFVLAGSGYLNTNASTKSAIETKGEYQFGTKTEPDGFLSPFEAYKRNINKNLTDLMKKAVTDRLTKPGTDRE